jgi:hypothetical protein
MEEVLDVQPGADICIRMKTDKSLPRVHSAENISALIKSPSNPKTTEIYIHVAAHNITSIRSPITGMLN